MSRTSAPALVLKWGGIALAMALVFWIATRMSAQGMWLGVSTVAFVGLCILAVYATRRAVPMKYLLPGFLCLLALQIWPLLYTVSMSFTNYGPGHLFSKEESIASIEANSVREVEGSSPVATSVPSGTARLSA